ncbi:hypothetical protein ONZ45_g19344 [Pleurotus djamor]|nr:hypothetical protein ONZ45_g19344 [Pleurotus djamor]
MAPKLQQFVASFHSIKESRLLHYLEFSNATITNFTLSFAPHARYDAVIDFSYLESFLLRLLPTSQHIPVRRMRVRIQNNSQILIEVFPHGQRSDAFLSLSIPFINSAAKSYLQFFHKLPLACIPELVFDALIPLKLLSGSVCQLPEELLQSAPWSSLRSLELINIPLPPDVPHLPLLSSAVVGDFPHGDDQLSVHWVTQFLQNTPNVESASFGGISGNNSSNVPETFSVILPKLRELHIVSHDLAGSKLFSYLDFPNTATICSVHLKQSKCTEATDLSPYEKLFRKMAIGERSDISEMRLSINDQSHRHEFTLELYCADDGPKPSMEGLFPWEKSSTSLFHQLLSRLPLSRIEKLRISDISQRSTALQWSPFIRLFTNLRELTLDSAIDDTLAVLMPDPNVTGSGSHSNPNLQCLIDHNSEWYSPIITPGHVNILDVFRRRREIGLPIERYIIQCGSIPRNMLEDLQKVVQVELDSETRVTADWSPD